MSLVHSYSAAADTQYPHRRLPFDEHTSSSSSTPNTETVIVARCSLTSVPLREKVCAFKQQTGQVPHWQSSDRLVC